ncbi:MAG: hypothetical protein KC620_12450, partial [Myxococcales bacterium]|nr:hypothetical protein [Myxococcales bacterium]
MAPDDLRLLLDAAATGALSPETLARAAFALGREGVDVIRALRFAGATEPELAAVQNHPTLTPAHDVSLAHTLAPPDADDLTQQGPPPDIGTADIEAYGLIGQRFGARYALGELIGRGGAGEVHAAQDRLLGRNVALKRLRQDGSRGEAAMQRFIAEARTTAQLEHPNVVPIYDIGLTADQ